MSKSIIYQYSSLSFWEIAIDDTEGELCDKKSPHFGRLIDVVALEEVNPVVWGLQKENEKLKAELEQLKSWKEETLYNIPHIDKTKDSANKEVESLKIENEKLNKIIAVYLNLTEKVLAEKEEGKIEKLKAQLEKTENELKEWKIRSWGI